MGNAVARSLASAPISQSQLGTAMMGFASLNPSRESEEAL
jgi:hypothetical protein